MNIISIGQTIKGSRDGTNEKVAKLGDERAFFSLAEFSYCLLYLACWALRGRCGQDHIIVTLRLVSDKYHQQNLGTSVTTTTIFLHSRSLGVPIMREEEIILNHIKAKAKTNEILFVQERKEEDHRFFLVIVRGEEVSISVNHWQSGVGLILKTASDSCVRIHSSFSECEKRRFSEQKMSSSKNVVIFFGVRSATMQRTKPEHNTEMG